LEIFRTSIVLELPAKAAFFVLIPEKTSPAGFPPGVSEAGFFVVFYAFEIGANPPASKLASVGTYFYRHHATLGRPSHSRPSNMRPLKLAPIR